uniref:Putative pancreatic lipase-like enzyme n=2 Tax=Nyssomyia neivai TaxID=330878 RepID=A0A1L8DPZ7_9DIPT
MFVSSSPFLLFCISYAICLLTSANGFRWPTSEEEALDEQNDFEILKAVQQSMHEWKIKSHHKHHRRKREEKRVCYGDLGCFEDSGPFGYLDMLPASPEEIDTKFYFYSTKNRGDHPLVEFSYFNISAAVGGDQPLSESTTVLSDSSTSNTSTAPVPTTSSHISLRRSLDNLEGLEILSARVIVHGFGSSCPHVWIYEMRTALMAVEDCIVICVDWEKGATLPNYVKAAANTRLVGKQLAQLLGALQTYRGLQMSRVHIIGFSLGAHVAGFAGADLPGLNRITGLDPAGPLFESQHPKARLDSSDASFVDVIHSNGENLILGGLGSWQPMGHVDFYPNGGRVQHGCSNLFVGAVTDFIWSPAASVEGRSLCNHRRAYKFFIDSVAPRCLFPAFPCGSYDEFLQGKCFPCKQSSNASGISTDARCGNMGYYADRSTGRGQLYLVTREEEPFCAHQYNIEIFSAVSDLPLRSLGRWEVTLIGEGGLNETFTITEKDDTEFFAGEKISRILVPHPALGFPTDIALTYKSYSGWLSRGLPVWNIYKVILTDSFGRSYSICKRFFTLDSGKPELLALLPGDCHIPEETDLEEGPLDRIDEKRSEENEVGVAFGSYEEDLRFTRDDRENSINPKWQIDGNGLDGSATESSRGFPEEIITTNSPPEIFEPILKEKRRKTGKGRKFDSDGSDAEEVLEPILRSTTPRNQNRSQEDARSAGDKRKSREGSSHTVQLFPFRLGEFLERAERYARLTLLPLISETAPRFFNFGTTSNEERKPRYLTDDDFKQAEIAEAVTKNLLNVTTENPTNVTDKDELLTHIGMENASNSRNLYEPLREETTNETRILLPRSASDSKYYTNLKDVVPPSALPNLTQVVQEENVIRIDLPTYRPPAVDFPYDFEVPATASGDLEEEVPEPTEIVEDTRRESNKFIPLTFNQDAEKV